jgi:hypothetical protein
MIKPILFSTPMVQAILAGRKSMTRRIVNKDISNQFDLEADGKTIVAYIDQETGDSYDPTKVARIQVGDILWVRETWRIGAWDYDRKAICVDYKAMGLIATTEWVHIDDRDQMDKYIIQSREDAKAAGLEFDNYGEYHWKYGCSPCRWRPSIFMPKSAARIWLKVTDVRCERLHDITPHDAWLEGCRVGNSFVWESHIQELKQICRDMFVNLWDHLNAKRGYGWDSNPWVWVYTFERCDKRTEAQP